MGHDPLKPQDKKSEDLIINRPRALSTGRKRTEFALTTVGWMVWMFLCRPVVLLLLWLLGVQIFYEHMIRLGGLSGLVDFTFVYCGVIFTIYLLIRGWNFYNTVKFRGKDRRRGDRAISGADLENFFELPPNSVARLRQAKSIEVEFDDDFVVRLRDTSQNAARHVRGKFKPT